MFKHLDDAQPPDGGAAYDAVLAAASSRRRKRRLFAGGGAAGVVAAIVAAFVLVPSSGGTSKLVTAPDATGAGSASRDELPRLPVTPSATPTPTHSTAPTAGPTARAVAAVGEPTSVPTDTPSPSPSPVTTCPPSTEHANSAPTEPQFEAQMEHVWLRCSSDAGREGAPIAVGFVVRADHTWSKLAPRSDGSFEVLYGWGNEGAWNTEDTASMNGTEYGRWQIDMHIDGDGTLMGEPAFASDAPVMNMQSFQRFVPTYVQGSRSDVVDPGRSTRTYGPGDPAGCTAQEGGEQPTAPSEAAFIQQVQHAWLLCDQPSFFGTNEDGLDIETGFQWAKLARGADGTWTRMAGAHNQGTWSVLQAGDAGDPRWQINFTFADGSSAGSLPAFAVNAPKMRLDNEGVYVADYVQLPDGAVTG
ncbi:MAG: hypothetical protein ACJ735_02000 [Actinomycetes bacterium]